MSSRLCKVFLNYIGNIMLYALLIALLGALLLFLSLLFGGLAVWSSSPSLAAALAAIFAHPVWGKFAAIGLVLFVGGLLLAFAMIVLYVLMLVVCCSLAGNVNDAAAGNKRDACDCGPLCLLGPLFPAAAFLILVLVITPILLFSTGRWDLGVTPNALLTAAAAMFGLFGLLLALAPVIWCCCKACKCKENQSGGGILAQAPIALAVDPSEGPH
jgi:hypothetical protein